MRTVLGGLALVSLLVFFSVADSLPTWVLIIPAACLWGAVAIIMVRAIRKDRP